MTRFRWKRAGVAVGMAWLVVVLTGPAQAGPLTLVQALREGVDPGVDGLFGAREVAVSPDGKHVYTCGQDDRAVSVFARDLISGELSIVEVLKDGVDGVDGLDGAFGLALSPGGDHVYVAGGSESKVAVFSRNSGTGELTFVEVQEDGVAGVTDMVGPQSLRLSPDGFHVYVAAIGGSVAVFSRNSTTGGLTFVEAQVDGAGGVDGLALARAVAVSPDGAHVYAVGQNDDAVAVFSRNGTTGALSFVEMQKNGVAGVTNLAGPKAIAVTPDGQHVYAAAISGFGSVVAFSRNATTGALTFVDDYPDGAAGIDGLQGASWVTVGGDGSRVYAVSVGDSAVVTFARNATTGELTFLGQERDGQGGVETLDNAETVAVSPDDAHIYTTASTDTAVSVFRPIEVTCATSPAGGCLAPDLPLKASLLLKEQTPDAGDLLLFKWVKGTTTLGDFGDPVATLNDYAVCLYDSTNALVVSAVAPAADTCKGGAACWKAVATGFKYVDGDRSPDGTTKIALKEGAGTGKVVVKAKGENLPSLPVLPLTLPVTAQVQTADGPCWTASFDLAGVIQSDGSFFKGRGD